MPDKKPILGVYLSQDFDLEALYGASVRAVGASDVQLCRPDQVTRAEDVQFALCWAPAAQAFAPYPNLDLAMSIGAGVDALIAHSGLPDNAVVARVRDPHQADLMAGFAAHAVLHHERGFDAMALSAAEAKWRQVPMRAPARQRIAVLGHGSMGRAVVKALVALGFDLHVACRTTPDAPLNGVTYHAGEGAMTRAAAGAAYLVNVLPLTRATENVLNKALFDQLRPGAVLIQIGRGEHLVEADLDAALSNGQLSGATLDVFRQEPLPPEHPWWRDARLRITPHVASDTLPEIVVEQAFDAARALRDGLPVPTAIDRQRGY